MDRHSTVRARSLCREALKSFVNGRVATAILVVAAASAVAITTIAEVGAAETARNGVHQLRDSGGYLFAIEPVRSNPLDPVDPLEQRDCERNRRISGVVAAGATGQTVEVGFGNVGRPLEITEVTPGVFDVVESIGVNPPPEPFDLLAGPVALERLGVASERSVSLEGYGTRRIREAPLGTVSAGFIGSVLGTVAPIGRTELCVVALEPRALEVAPLLRATFGRSDTTLRRVLTGADLIGSPFDDYSSRVERHAWWLLAAAYAGVARFVIWTRRSELALYRALGLGVNAIRLMIAVELAVGCVVGASIGMVVGRLLMTGSHSHSLLIGWLGALLVSLAFVTTAVAVAASVTTRKPLAGLKDR